MTVPNQPTPSAEAPGCYRHPDRVTYVRCARCNQPICPECMHEAAIGHQCPDCAAAGRTARRQPRTRTIVRTSAAAPIITYALIAVNVVAFVVQQLPGGPADELVLWSPGVAVYGQYYRLVTSAFLHYGPMHLLFNMWALYVVGPALEALLGRLRFTALYGLCALGGSVAVYLLAPLNSATAGASGAIFGLFGATFVVGRRLRLDVGWIAAVIVLNLAFTFTVPHISWQGHVGGLVTGTVLAVGYVYPPARRRRIVQSAVTVAAVVLFAGLIWWRTAELTAALTVG